MADDDAELTAEEILTFGPVVESQVWTPTFIAEKRAPIAVAAGRPKLGPVFNSDGVGKAVLIRPCVSRGKRIRGLPPIYKPGMLERDALVFAGWPMYFDHVAAGVSEELAEALREAFAHLREAARARSVKEMGGQVLTPYFDREFVQEGDGDYGYQQGGVLAEIWGSPVLRGIVGNNPDLLHTSIAAWPTSGKPEQVPWNAGVRGMAIEGIRRQPQGSVDFVPRGGAGGRLLLSEGEDPDTSAWPEPRWEEQDVRLVVSLAESFYASGAMSQPTGTPPQSPPNFATMTPDALRAYLAENATHLLPALRESAQPPAAPAPTVTGGLTEADVRRIVTEAQSKTPTRESVEELAESLISEREGQRHLSGVAFELIEAAEGIPVKWKADLKARYAMLPSGPQPALLVEAATDDDGKELSEADVLRNRVKADLTHARELIEAATGKPRVTGEGGGSSRSSGVEKPGKTAEGAVPYWRQRFADMGIVESADDALTVHGVDRVEG